MALPDYNQQFLFQLPGGTIYNDATQYGLEIQTLADIRVPEGTQNYWRVVGVHHLTGAENGGNHHIYVDVLDEAGQRLNGTRLVLRQGSSAPLYAVVDKPINEAGTNFPMWSNTRGTVAVEDALPSESVSGLRSDHADEDAGNTWGHHSFYVVFQRTEVAETEPVVPDPPDPGQTVEEAIASTGQPLIIPLNPDAGFYKFAKQQGLGERLTSEYDVEHLGRSYRAQIYETGIIYAEVGDWGNIKIIPRIN